MLQRCIVLLMLFLFIQNSSNEIQRLEKQSNCLLSCRQCSKTDPQQCIWNGETAECIDGSKLKESNSKTKQCVIDDRLVVSLSSAYNNDHLKHQKQDQFQNWSNAQQIECKIPSVNSSLKALQRQQKKHEIRRQYFLGNNFNNGLLTFNLLYRDWIPYDDILSIELQARGLTLRKFEIYQEVRRSIDEDEGALLCEGQYYLPQKYKIWIDLNTMVSEKSITLVFKGKDSTLKRDSWAITNIDLHFSCGNWAALNHHNECEKCDPGFYKSNGGCKSCPEGCFQCSSPHNCSDCAYSYRLLGFSCHLDAEFQTIVPTFTEEEKICSDFSFHNAEKNPQKGYEISTNAFELGARSKKCRAMFTFLYPSREWAKANDSFQVRFNGKVVGQFAPKDLKNQAVDYCSHLGLDVTRQLLEVSDLDCEGSSGLLHFSTKNQPFGLAGLTLFQAAVEKKKLTSANNLNRGAIENVTQFKVQVFPYESKGLKVKLVSPTMINLSEIVIKVENMVPQQREFSLLADVDKRTKIVFLPLNGSFLDIKIQILRKLKKLGHNGSPLMTETYQVPRTQYFHEHFVSRYDSLMMRELQFFSMIQAFMSFFAWFCILCMILGTMFRFSMIIQEYVFTLQLIFLHVYIEAESLPQNFSRALKGLASIENLNYLSLHQTLQLQRLIFGDYLENSPLRFMQFNTDINFLRGVFPMLFLTVFYLCWFAGWRLFRKWGYVQRNPNKWVSMLCNRISLNFMGYMDQIWRQQFLAMIWICCIQFYNTEMIPQYPITFISTPVCLLAFFFYLGYMVGSWMYISRQYYLCEYSIFFTKYHDMFFYRLPKETLPSNAYFLHRLIHFTKLMVYALAASIFGMVPIVSIGCILLAHVLNLSYVNYYEVYQDIHYKRINTVESASLCILAVLHLFVYEISNMAGKKLYFIFGYVLIGVAVFLTINGLVRSFYLAVKKFRQEFRLKEEEEQVQPKS